MNNVKSIDQVRAEQTMESEIRSAERLEIPSIFDQQSFAGVQIIVVPDAEVTTSLLERCKPRTLFDKTPIAVTASEFQAIKRNMSRSQIYVNDGQIDPSDIAAARSVSNAGTWFHHVPKGELFLDPHKIEEPQGRLMPGKTWAFPEPAVQLMSACWCCNRQIEGSEQYCPHCGWECYVKHEEISVEDAKKLYPKLGLGLGMVEMFQKAHDDLLKYGEDGPLDVDTLEYYEPKGLDYLGAKQLTIEKGRSQRLANALENIDQAAETLVTPMPIQIPVVDGMIQTASPLAPTRKATKNERRAMRHALVRSLRHLHPMFRDNKGGAKQLAHSLIRKATK